MLIAITSAIATVLLVTFGIGAAICHISSLSQARQWIVDSGHSIGAERRFVRFPGGFTRTFFYLGDEGKTLKRFVFGDPYAPVRWSGLMSAGLWKVLLVFGALGSLLLSLARTREGRIPLFIALAGMIPTLWFALCLFETGQPERYLPLYPALLVTVCLFLRQPAKTRTAVWALGIFVCAMAIVNLKAYAGDLRGLDKRSNGRVELVHRNTLNGGVALILYFDDPISGYYGRFPLDAGNEPHALPLYHVMELEDNAPWSAGSSCRILRAWGAGGQAWLSKRLIAPRPQPDWGWVENDHPGLHWTDLRQFFAALETDSDLGDADGFVRVAPTGKNYAVLQATCGSGQKSRETQ